MTRNVIKSRTYAVSCANDCTVKTGDGLLICSVSAGVQSQFVAVCDEVVISDDSALCELAFNPAPAGSASSGGSESSQAYAVVTPSSSLVLSAGAVTDIGALSADTDLSDMAVSGASSSTVATAELWLSTGETVPSITWPEGAVWLAGTSEGSAPTLEASTKYRFAVCQEPDGTLIINLMHSYGVTNED